MIQCKCGVVGAKPVSSACDVVRVKSVSSAKPLTVKIPTQGGHTAVPKYEGEYEITPMAFSDQRLPTANKLLEKDIVVKKVPFYETSNDNGSTIYIASEV